jgi:hypothetical protein
MIVQTLKSMYTVPSRHREARLNTLAPLIARAHAARDEHMVLTLQHEDTAHAAAKLDTRQVARFLRPELLPVVGRLRASAITLRDAGTAADLVAAIHAATDLVDSDQDRAFEASAAELTKVVDQVENTVRSLRQAAATLTTALATLEAEPELAAAAINVPKPNTQPTDVA